MRSNDAMLEMLAAANKQNGVASLQERQVRALERIAENLQLIAETANTELNYAKKPKKARI